MGKSGLGVFADWHFFVGSILGVVAIGHRLR
jgi:hypothetical protein